jgi:hypothetical protein
MRWCAERTLVCAFAGGTGNLLPVLRSNQLELLLAGQRFRLRINFLDLCQLNIGRDILSCKTYVAHREIGEPVNG